MQKAGLYQPLRYKNLETKLKGHLIRHYEFAKKSRLSDSLLDLVLGEFDRDEASRGITRVKPWQLVFRRGQNVALLTLFTDDDLLRSMRGARLRDVRKTIENRCLRELQTVWPDATLLDLRAMINVRGLTRKHRTGSKAKPLDVKPKGPDDRLADPPKLIDVRRFAKNVTKRQVSAADGLVSAEVLQRLTRQLQDDYHIPPKLGDLVLQDLASIRTECLPRVDEMKHGQAMVLTTDSHSRIGAACVPEEQRVQPVIVTLFTERERKALSFDDITFPKARDIQLKQIVRVHVEAYAQGGLLSYVDSQWLFSTSYHSIGQAINHYEQIENVFVPTPGTVLDAGNKVTHKLLIVRLYLDGLTTTQIARRTYHSEAAVDNYIGSFDKVAMLHWYGVSRAHMRLVLGRSLRLIDEYLCLVKRYFKDRETIREYLNSRGHQVA